MSDWRATIEHICIARSWQVLNLRLPKTKLWTALSRTVDMAEGFMIVDDTKPTDYSSYRSKGIGAPFLLEAIYSYW